MSKIRMIGLFLILISIEVFAVDVPHRMPSGRSDFTFHSLGSTCYTMEAYLGGLPCNPANVAKEREHNFNTQFFYGNNVEYVEDVEKVLGNTADERTVQRLFNQDRDAQLEANLELGYLRKNFSVGVSPARVNYHSLIRNRIHPVLNLYASQETSVRTQLGTSFDDQYYLGFQVRGVQRKFIMNDIFLTEALAENATSRLFATQEQKALYLEPGFVWVPQNIMLEPQFSAQVNQLGYVDRRYEDLPVGTEGHLGVSIRPPVDNGNLELGTRVSFHNEYNEPTELFGVGASYQRGIAQYSGSLEPDHAAVSLLLNYKAVRGGLIYDYRRFENLVGETDSVGTFFIEVGAEI